jgi:hypothetical protein
MRPSYGPWEPFGSVGERVPGDYCYMLCLVRRYLNTDGMSRKRYRSQKQGPFAFPLQVFSAKSWIIPTEEGSRKVNLRFDRLHCVVNNLQQSSHIVGPETEVSCYVRSFHLGTNNYRQAVPHWQATRRTTRKSAFDSWYEEKIFQFFTESRRALRPQSRWILDALSQGSIGQGTNMITRLLLCKG